MHNEIQEDALRSLVDGGAVRDTLVRCQEEKLTLAVRLGGWQPLVGGKFAPRSAAYLGQPDGCRAICGCDGITGI